MQVPRDPCLQTLSSHSTVTVEGLSKENTTGPD